MIFDLIIIFLISFLLFPSVHLIAKELTIISVPIQKSSSPLSLVPANDLSEPFVFNFEITLPSISSFFSCYVIIMCTNPKSASPPSMKSSGGGVSSIKFSSKFSSKFPSKFSSKFSNLSASKTSDFFNVSAASLLLLLLFPRAPGLRIFNSCERDFDSMFV